MWQGTMATRIATAWRGYSARRVVSGVRTSKTNAIRTAAAARLAASFGARAVIGQRRIIAAAACLARAWRCRTARLCAVGLRVESYNGGAVIGRMYLSLREATPLEVMDTALTTGGRFRVSLLDAGDGGDASGGGGGGAVEQAWLCPQHRVLDKVSTTPKAIDTGIHNKTIQYHRKPGIDLGAPYETSRY